jgi:hypothetical protein
MPPRHLPRIASKGLVSSVCPSERRIARGRQVCREDVASRAGRRPRAPRDDPDNDVRSGRSTARLRRYEPLVGSYRVAGRTIEFGAIATMKMAGPEQAMRRERELLSALPDRLPFSIAGDLLVVGEGAASARFRRSEVRAPDPTSAYDSKEERNVGCQGTAREVSKMSVHAAARWYSGMSPPSSSWRLIS